MKSDLDKNKDDWRDISMWDRFRSLYQKTPAIFGEYCDEFDKWLNSKLDTHTEIKSFSHYEMTITDGSSSITLKIGGYPHHYGTLDCRTYSTFWRKNPRWETVLRIRALQLTKRDEHISNYIEEAKNPTGVK